MTDEQWAKVQWLSRAKFADLKAAALEANRERDRSLAQRLSRCGDGGGSSGGNSTERALLRLAASEADAEAALRKARSVRTEIAAAIDAAQLDDLSHAILTRRYLDYESMEQIAEHIHYSVSSVQRRHKAALEKVAME